MGTPPIDASVCPSCDAVVAATMEFCPSCLGSLSSPSPGPGPAEEARSDPAVQPAAEVPAVEGVAMCPHHPTRPLGGACTGCGREVCIDCAPDLLRSDKYTCPDCVLQIERGLRPEKLSDACRDVALVSALFGFSGLVIVGFLPSMLFDRSFNGIPWAVIGGGISVPYFVVALAVWFGRSPVAAWFAFALQGWATVSVVFTMGASLVSAVFVGVTAGTFWKCLVLQGLSKTPALDPPASAAVSSEALEPPKRVAGLAALEVSAPGTPALLSPPFHPTVTMYSVNVPLLVSWARVTATAADESSTIQINTVASESGVESAPIELLPGPTAAYVDVTTPGFPARSYMITIIRSRV